MEPVGLYRCHGVTLKGRNLVTIVGGKIVYNGL